MTGTSLVERNRSETSITLVDSASPGSQDCAWLFWTLVSLPANGASTAIAITHNTSTTHLPTLLLGTLASVPTPLINAFTSLYPFRCPKLDTGYWWQGPNATHSTSDST